MSKTAREVITGSAECIGENESIGVAAEKMKRLDVCALPICGEDNRLQGTAGLFGEGKAELDNEQVGELVGTISE